MFVITIINFLKIQCMHFGNVLVSHLSMIQILCGISKEPLFSTVLWTYSSLSLIEGRILSFLMFWCGQSSIEEIFFTRWTNLFPSLKFYPMQFQLMQIFFVLSLMICQLLILAFHLELCGFLLLT